VSLVFPSSGKNTITDKIIPFFNWDHNLIEDVFNCLWINVKQPIQVNKILFYGFFSSGLRAGSSRSPYDMAEIISGACLGAPLIKTSL
jgi:hypothetical protein